jgi:hypothetical protein
MMGPKDTHKFVNDVGKFVDSAADVDKFVEETVAKMADLLRADDAREPWLSTRAQAAFNSCRHGAKMMRQCTKANGEQPRDGECVWVCKDRPGAGCYLQVAEGVTDTCPCRKSGVECGSACHLDAAGKTVLQPLRTKASSADPATPNAPPTGCHPSAPPPRPLPETSSKNPAQGLV